MTTPTMTDAAWAEEIRRRVEESGRVESIPADVVFAEVQAQLDEFARERRSSMTESSSAIAD